jgi:hypothetical protein
VTDIYTHGHHESVLRSHRWRAAENSAAYLLPFLEPGAERVTASSLAERAVEYGLSSPDELEAIAAASRRWLVQDDGFFVVLHGELIARR